MKTEHDIGPPEDGPHQNAHLSRSRMLYRATLLVGIVLQPLTLLALFFGVAMCNIGHGPYTKEGGYLIIGGLSGQATSWLLLVAAAIAKIRSTSGEARLNALAVLVAVVFVFGGAALLFWASLTGAL